jgi:hypothetical protein
MVLRQPIFYAWRLLGEVQERTFAQLVAGHQRPGHQLPAFHKRLVFVGEQAERGAAQNLVEGGLPVPCPRDGLYRLRRLREVPIIALGAEKARVKREIPGLAGSKWCRAPSRRAKLFRLSLASRLRALSDVRRG